MSFTCLLPDGPRTGARILAVVLAMGSSHGMVLIRRSDIVWAIVSSSRGRHPQIGRRPPDDRCTSFSNIEANDVPYGGRSHIDLLCAAVMLGHYWVEHLWSSGMARAFVRRSPNAMAT